MIESVTREVHDLLGDGFRNCQSPSLRLEKHVRLGDNSKREEIEEVCRLAPLEALANPVVPPNAVRFVLRLDSRLIVNQAGGILENAGLCLHRHFGFPVIPGSALKGLARHAAWCEWNEESNPEAKRRIALDIARVFGFPTGDKGGLDAALEDCPRSSGTIAFLPAVPDGRAHLAVDIVNCHHHAYYAAKEEGARAFDDESPIPNFFPAVEAGSKFVFTLAPVRGNDLPLAKKWLLHALTHFGAGAKTAAGYGVFDALRESEWTADWAKRAEDRLRRAREEQVLEDWKRQAETWLARFPEGPVPQEERKTVRRLLDEGREFSSAQTVLDALKAAQKRIPEASPAERIRTLPEKEFFKNYVARFDSLKPEIRQAIVEFLRDKEGPGAERWAKLRTGQKGDIDKGVQAIRKYCKETLGLGKMP